MIRGDCSIEKFPGDLTFVLRLVTGLALGLADRPRTLESEKQRDQSNCNLYTVYRIVQVPETGDGATKIATMLLTEKQIAVGWDEE